MPPTNIFAKNGLTIPWVNSVPYLGIVLSFENPENLTVDNNLMKAKSRYMQLRKLLTGRSSLSRQHRIELWTTCIVPIALCGLEVTGITDKGASQLRALLIRQLRAIARSPAHLTHESTSALQALLSLISHV